MVHAARKENACVCLFASAPIEVQLSHRAAEPILDLVAAYHGLIFIDSRKHFVHRITLHADGIPPYFPIQE